MNMEIPMLFHDIEWRRARVWIGRRLILKTQWLNFEAGTPCRVMSLVDFGDGLLFWIRTDDPAGLDVDQVTRRELERHFQVQYHRPKTNRSRRGQGSRPDTDSVAAARPARRALEGES